MLFLLRRRALEPFLETLEEHLLALFTSSAVVLLDTGEPVGEFVIALLSSILDVGLKSPHIAQRGFDGPDEVVVLVFDRAADVGDHCDHLLSAGASAPAGIVHASDPLSNTTGVTGCAASCYGVLEVCLTVLQAHSTFVAGVTGGEVCELGGPQRCEGSGGFGGEHARCRAHVIPTVVEHRDALDDDSV